MNTHLNCGQDTRDKNREINCINSFLEKENSGVFFYSVESHWIRDQDHAVAVKLG